MTPHGSKGNWRPTLVRQRELPLDHFFVRLRESGFSFDAQPPGVVKQLVDALVRDFSIEQFAHARLRHRRGGTLPSQQSGAEG
jgi:hypothetical protein